MLSRRRFLAGSGGFVGLAGLAAYAAATFESDSEAAKGVIVNHLGFTPTAAKWCLLPGTRPLEFKVLRVDSGRPVLRGRLSPSRGDLGDYVVGDFSAVKEPGSYRIAAGSSTSGRFEVDAALYAEPLRKCVAYFPCNAVVTVRPATTPHATWMMAVGLTTASGTTPPEAGTTRATSENGSTQPCSA
jgi:hypothetical protein